MQVSLGPGRGRAGHPAPLAARKSSLHTCRAASKSDLDWGREVLPSRPPKPGQEWPQDILRAPESPPEPRTVNPEDNVWTNPEDTRWRNIRERRQADVEQALEHKTDDERPRHSKAGAFASGGRATASKRKAGAKSQPAANSKAATKGKAAARRPAAKMQTGYSRRTLESALNRRDPTEVHRLIEWCASVRQLEQHPVPPEQNLTPREMQPAQGTGGLLEAQ